MGGQNRYNVKNANSQKRGGRANVQLLDQNAIALKAKQNSLSGDLPEDDSCNVLPQTVLWGPALNDGSLLILSSPEYVLSSPYSVVAACTLKHQWHSADTFGG